MKKLILPGILFSFVLLALMAFTYPSLNRSGINPQDKPESTMTGDVTKFFENHCYDCHSENSSNAKAKLKLNFSNWDEMSDAKKVGKMEKISEVITKGDMPPGKYIEKNPDKKPTDDQKTLISNWATEESKKLMGE